MTVLLAVLVSGVLLGPMDLPVPAHYVSFTSSSAKVIELVTDKDGKFSVELPPGNYLVKMNPGRFGVGDSIITVDEKTSPLKLRFIEVEIREWIDRAPPP